MDKLQSRIYLYLIIWRGSKIIKRRECKIKGRNCRNVLLSQMFENRLNLYKNIRRSRTNKRLNWNHPQIIKRPILNWIITISQKPILKKIRRISLKVSNCLLAIKIITIRNLLRILIMWLVICKKLYWECRQVGKKENSQIK